MSSARSKWPSAIGSSNHYLQQREDRSQGAPLPEEKRKGRRKKKSGNKPQFDLRTGLFRMSGTDLTRIDGIDVMTATTILSEAGWDMSKWKTEDHFVSWLRLCPDNRISGSKIIGKGRLPTNNRVTIALKMAASTLRQSRYLSGSAVPSTQNQTRRSRRDQGHGRQAGPLGLPHAPLRHEIRRPRSGALRSSTAHRQIKHLKLQSRQLGIPSSPSYRRLKHVEFLGSSGHRFAVVV